RLPPLLACARGTTRTRADFPRNRLTENARVSSKLYNVGARGHRRLGRRRHHSAICEKSRVTPRKKRALRAHTISGNQHWACTQHHRGTPKSTNKHENSILKICANERVPGISHKRIECVQGLKAENTNKRWKYRTDAAHMRNFGISSAIFLS